METRWSSPLHAVGDVVFLASLAGCIWFGGNLAVFAAGALGTFRAFSLVFGAIPLVIVLCLSMLLAPRRRRYKFAILAAVGLVVLLNIVPWHPRMQFANKYHAIELGMTESRAVALLEQYDFEQGIPAAGNETSHFRPSHHLRYRWDTGNDAILIDVRDGVVVAKRFIED